MQDLTLLFAENYLNRHFTAEKPNEKWVSDITYIPVRGGHVYLAVVMDLFSRKVIGWSLDKTMTTKLIMNALNMATGGFHQDTSKLVAVQFNQ